MASVSNRQLYILLRDHYILHHEQNLFHNQPLGEDDTVCCEVWVNFNIYGLELNSTNRMPRL